MAIQPRPMPLVSTEDLKRFWSNVDRREDNECWPWLAGVNHHRGGYGRFWIKRVEYRTNRMAFWLHYGIDPAEQEACHACDNPPCCNPAHLFRGTRADNHADMRRKNRQPKGESHGISVLTVDQVKEIKRLYIPRRVGCYQLADRFGVSEMTVHKIISGKTWTHINPE